MHLLAREVMEQSVTIWIAGKAFPLKASTPEVEQMMRMAAEQINQRLSEFDSIYPNKTLADKLAFVALKETVAQISFRRKLVELDKDIKQMTEETERYLNLLEEK